jgi:hypothetical protein
MLIKITEFFCPGIPTFSDVLDCVIEANAKKEAVRLTWLSAKPEKHERIILPGDDSKEIWRQITKADE